MDSSLKIVTRKNEYAGRDNVIDDTQIWLDKGAPRGNLFKLPFPFIGYCKRGMNFRKEWSDVTNLVMSVEVGGTAKIFCVIPKKYNRGKRK